MKHYIVRWVDTGRILSSFSAATTKARNLVYPSSDDDQTIVIEVPKLALNEVVDMSDELDLTTSEPSPEEP